MEMFLWVIFIYRKKIIKYFICIHICFHICFLNCFVNVFFMFSSFVHNADIQPKAALDNNFNELVCY